MYRHRHHPWTLTPWECSKFHDDSSHLISDRTSHLISHLITSTPSYIRHPTRYSKFYEIKGITDGAGATPLPNPPSDPPMHAIPSHAGPEATRGSWSHTPPFTPPYLMSTGAADPEATRDSAPSV
jgi:hypothetical protein